jgi:hypothetical protein
MGVLEDYSRAIHFETTKPLATAPVVEYTIAKNEKGENDVVMTVLKNTTEAPIPNVQRAVVTMQDDRRFVVRIPLEKSDYPANFFLGSKKMGRVAFVPEKENPSVETEEENEQPH